MILYLLKNFDILQTKFLFYQIKNKREIVKKQMFFYVEKYKQK